MTTWPRTSAGAPARSLILVLGVALLLRVWGLDARGLWFDEAYSVYIARQPLADIPDLVARYDTHPPLYYMLLRAWVAVSGTGEVAVRLLSVFIGVGVVALTYLLARRLLDHRAGVLAAAIAAVSPFQVVASQEARMYPLLALLSVGASYALWIALEDDRRVHWVAYGALTLLSLYTHHFAMLIVLAHALHVMLFGQGHRVRWVLVATLLLIAYAPFHPGLREQVLTAKAWPDIRSPFGLSNLADLAGLLTFGGGSLRMGTYFRSGTLPQLHSVVFLSLVFGTVAFAAFRLQLKTRSFLLALFLLPIAAVSLVSLRWNLFYARHFSFLVPMFAVIVAGGALSLLGTLKRGRPAVLALALAASLALVVPGLVRTYRAESEYDWRAAAAHVARNGQASDFILYIPAFARIPFEYYFTGPQRRMSINPETVTLGSHQVAFRTEVDEARLIEIARDHPRVWIVATVPIGTQARLEIWRQLSSYFRDVEARQFGLVVTFAWESRLHAVPGGRDDTR